MLEAALAYASRLGWPVFPCCWITEAETCSCGFPDCSSRGKHPLPRRGFKEASRDQAQIRAWWSRWPAANVGISTGQASGFDVLDVDPRHGGEEALAELELLHGKLPATVEAITGGGGRHILFRHREGIANKVGFLPGLDVRGDGGYILAAPSGHASGRRYQWGSRPGEVELAEWPVWLQELVQKPAHEAQRTPPPAPQEGQSGAYGRAALQGEVERVRHAPPGLQESTLNTAALKIGTLVGGGALDHGEALAALVEAGRQMVNQQGRPPWTLAQVQKKAEHGLADGMRQPRAVPALAPKQGAKEAQGTTTTPAPSTSYSIKDGCLGYMKKLGRGDDATEIFSSLCNFTAQVVEERALDDGLEVKRRFLIEGRLADGTPLPRVEVSAVQFAAMRWPVDLWGVRARICAGMGAQDRLREAVQVFSAGAQVRHAYAHTGWRKIDGAWCYLHAGLTDTEVLLESPLNRYALPVKADDVAGALRLSLALLDVGPDEVTIPLLSAVYLSVLCEFLRPDFVLFLLGRTGSLKSTLAALFLSHFGHFPDKNALPASWESTDNAIEKRLFILKDTLVPVDDYAPRADAHAQRQQAQRAQRIIRGMGNLSGRSRLRSDLSGRPDYAPRGLMLSTGEDLPPGQSILARILSVEVDRSRLHLLKITEAQKQAGRLPHAMAGYLAWLAPQLDELSRALPEQWREHRARFTEKAAHLRIPEILAHLALGIDLLTSFARDMGALSEPEIENLAQRTHRALLNLGEAHGHRVREEDPAEVFLSTTGAMLAQGAVALAQRDSLAEVDNLIGWRDGEYAYLIPEAAHHAVGRFLRDGGGHFPYSARALNKALDARGALVKGPDGKGPRLVKIRGKAQRVLQIPISLLEPEEEEAGETVTRTVTPK
jgi:hypothetical protein